MSQKKLFLLDAMALIYRAHFALGKTPRITSKGLNTGAVFGFTNTLLEVLKKEKPTHIAVAYDTAAPTFRHVAFDAYKAQRQAQPEDITVAVPYTKQLLQAMNIPVLVKEGFEADDIIGTIAKRAAQHGFDVYMMTPDKDYGQLVEEHIFLYKPAFMGNASEVWGIPEVLNRWGVERIDQVVEMLGLQGDAVDNIPGIPGFGEKTAQKLIAEYGTIENLIANADKLKGKQQDLVKQYADQARLSRQLAVIDINVPVEFDEETFRCQESNKEELIRLLDELEFRTIRKKLFGEDGATLATATKSVAKAKKPADSSQMDLFGAPAPAGGEGELPPFLDYTGGRKSIADTLHQYHVINTPELRQSLIKHLNNQKVFCFDSETTSIDATQGELVGLSFSYYAGEAYYVPFPADQAEAQKILEEFRGVFENPKIQKIGQNIKYDLIILKNYGIEVKGQLFDTMLAHYLSEPEGRHNMDYLAENYLNYSPVSIETLIGKKGKNQLTMRDVEIEKVAEYAGEDADVTFQLYDIFHKRLKTDQLEKLFWDVEMPLVPVLADIEQAGVRIDETALKELSLSLEGDLKGLEEKIYALAGQTLNINSPKQLGEVLFDKLKLDPGAKKTKTGQYATGEEVLSKLEPNHEIIRHILDYRELQKLKSTYIDALPLLISPRDGRIHTSFNQAVTATGRLSSTNPNLQNIPIRTERGREIRKAFVPVDNDHLILSADYSQIELRLMAEFSGDPTMMDAFKNGRDIHASTASKVFKVPLEEVNAEMRRKAKTINFGIIYGISAFGLSQRLNIPRREAAEIIDSYFQEFPLIKKFIDDSIIKAQDKGYVETLLGRRRYLRDINSMNQTDRGFAERNAVNAPLQGTAADIIKLAMIRIHEFLKKENLRTRMILQVHDELVFDAHKEELSVVKPAIEDLMKNALPLSVPMEIGIGTGISWLEAH
ncbi:DNA polymerase I [Xanthocytophaga flava]|uniref:DNA polymerase I n=1 Tax=Xanthocytophaga flava TaxID=3048013 RepID=UPI0028D67661|nr:DNA polymerase I [Xanthocytophaga flavus]MDJ1471234.1 DNA polymerase I [Xanthocytophaga flavus]